MADALAAELAAIRAREQARDIPRLLAAVEAALAEAGRWEDETEEPTSALTEDRAWVRSACANRLRKAIVRELAGEAACRHCGKQVIRCEHPAHPLCKGWFHAGHEDQPVIGHCCEGRSINEVAEPIVEADRG